jgi:GNAT superfamily N-acetyltransferase
MLKNKLPYSYYPIIIKPNELSKYHKQIIYDFDQEHFPECISSPLRDTFWLFVYYKDPSNIIAYSALDMNRKKDYYFLARSGVDEEHRGNGIQKYMIRSRIEYAKTISNKQIMTYTHPENIASMNSLISCDFRIFKPKYRFAGKNMIYWQYKGL